MEEKNKYLWCFQADVEMYNLSVYVWNVWSSLHQYEVCEGVKFAF